MLTFWVLFKLTGLDSTLSVWPHEVLGFTGDFFSRPLPYGSCFSSFSLQLYKGLSLLPTLGLIIKYLTFSSPYLFFTCFTPIHKNMLIHYLFKNKITKWGNLNLFPKFWEEQHPKNTRHRPLIPSSLGIWWAPMMELVLSLLISLFLIRNFCNMLHLYSNFHFVNLHLSSRYFLSFLTVPQVFGILTENLSLYPLTVSVPNYQQVMEVLLHMRTMIIFVLVSLI